MKIYKYKEDTERFQSLSPVSSNTFSRFRNLDLNGTDQWTPPNLRWVGATDRGDFPYLTTHVPVVSTQAMDLLEPYFGSIEVLPIKTPGGGYHALYVRDVIECLDHEQSTIDWLEKGIAYTIDKYVFEPAKLKNVHIFRIPEYRLSGVYLSSEAMNAIQNAGLKGIEPDSCIWHD